MAKLTGGLLGLASLLYFFFGMLSGWHDLSFGLKVVVLFVPSMFLTIAIVGALAIAGILIQRLYHQLRGTQAKAEYGLLNNQAVVKLMLPAWFAVALGLYKLVEHFFG
ncbi:hypothetical protein IRZ59_16010 [Pseudomonas guariconensis]|uniref:hypothetical protein n=1 Tax=Pseudomonas guariconensis TaxID=1288410 RepID=UPI0018AA8D97|nr:hypothetical protein [Pseudomonas guariconensis]MBF8731942.1 hypothetical protein [Pseudomonas guariconensis]